MVRSELTEFLLRRDVLWAGIGLCFVGALTPETGVAGTWLGPTLVAVGSTLFFARVFLGLWLVGRTTVEAGRYGYAEGQLEAVREES